MIDSFEDRGSMDNGAPFFKVYLTSLTAIDPYDGELKEYAGPEIVATSEADAYDIAARSGMPYLKIDGYKVSFPDIAHKIMDDVQQSFTYRCKLN